MSNPANTTINIDGNLFTAINELMMQFNRLTDTVSAMEEKVEVAFHNISEEAGQVQSSLRVLAFDVITRISDTLGQSLRSATDAVYAYDKALRKLSAISNLAGNTLDQIGASARQMAIEFGGSAANHQNTYQVLLSRLTPELAKALDALYLSTLFLNFK